MKIGFMELGGIPELTPTKRAKEADLSRGCNCNKLFEPEVPKLYLKEDLNFLTVDCLAYFLLRK